MSASLAPLDLVWHTGGGHNARQGRFPRKLELGPAPARLLQAQGGVQAAVVFNAEGIAFVADTSGAVQAFGAADLPLWLTRLEGRVFASPAVMPDANRLFVGTDLGWVYALEGGTGKVVWRTQLPSRSDPRILGDLLCLAGQNLVIASSWGGRFHALDVQSGAERFSWDAGLYPYAGASADAGECGYCLRALAGQGMELVAIAPGGEVTVLHRVPDTPRGARRAPVSASPVVDGARGRVYFITHLEARGTLHAWEIQARRLLWSFPLAGSALATPALTATGRIMVATGKGEIEAVEPDGTRAYRYVSGCEYLLGGPVCDDADQVFFGDPTGVLHRLNASGVGAPCFEAARAFQARPSFDPRGQLYLPGTDGTVYIFAG